MREMPRKSAASLAVVSTSQPPPKLAPSPEAPAAVVAVFREILAATPADQFRPGDAPLIQAYAEAIVMARQAAQELATAGAVVQGRASAWLVVQEKVHRAITAMSARLRLSPQHRADRYSAARKANGLPPSPYEMMDDDQG
jgi:hypothetical protein